jgi:Ca2+:H+ antiporter
MAVIAGGIGRERQQFSKRYASINSTMLFIAVVALVIPAVFGFAVFGHIEEHGPRVEQLSLWTCIVLVVLYALNMLFTFGRARKARGFAHAGGGCAGDCDGAGGMAERNSCR